MGGVSENTSLPVVNSRTVGAVEVLLHLCEKQSGAQSSLQIAGFGG